VVGCSGVWCKWGCSQAVCVWGCVVCGPYKKQGGGSVRATKLPSVLLRYVGNRPVLYRTITFARQRAREKVSVVRVQASPSRCHAGRQRRQARCVNAERRTTAIMSVQRRGENGRQWEVRVRYKRKPCL